MQNIKRYKRSQTDDFGLEVFRPTIYKFFKITRWKKTDFKKVLDCGVGGRNPPIALFSKHGYECYGIDNSEDVLGHANEFLQKYELDVKLTKGDMRELSRRILEYGAWGRNSLIIFHGRRSRKNARRN